jgi:hypothetical protein
MAGSGYKLFSTGDVLTANDANTYFMQQTVMVFASSAARTTALTSVLAEGMVSYLTDTNAVQVYNGSAWVDVSAPSYPWTTYATVTGNMTVGNGTLISRYQQIGKTVHVFVQFTLGSTSAIATTPYFSLPFTAAQDKWAIYGRLTDNGIKDWSGFAQCNTANVFLYALGSGGVWADASTVTATQPFTWATGDYFTFFFSYEAA